MAGRELHGTRGLLQKWIRRIERVFVYSMQAERFFIQKRGGQRDFKAINVIDTNAILASLKEAGEINKEQGLYVVFVGAINKTKRMEFLVDFCWRTVSEV